MDEGNWPTEDEVVDALRRSGHLMEQEVATDLERLGWNVITHRAWKDADEGKSRELDVWASRVLLHDEETRLQIVAALLVECKYTAAPFAFLTRPLTPRDRNITPQEFVFPVPDYKQEVQIDKGRTRIHSREAFFYLGLDELYWPWKSGHRAVHVTRLDRKKVWSADNEGVFDSLVYPLAKALKAFKPAVRSEPDPEKWKTVALLFPIVVLSSRLFTVSGTSAKPSAEVVSSVRLQRELKDKHLDGVFGIDFVQREGLTEWVSDTLTPFCELVAAIFRDRPDRSWQWRVTDLV